ncbi:glycosyltransferase [Blautia difficilis]|uniref:glycosyltransferase n=1 Tax=Blautia difficilis TaxID=2763027 RepID=UPI003D97E629
MKKILHISKYYYPFSGGTEQIARDVVLALKGEYEQKVIAFNDGKDDRTDTVDGIEVIKCGCFVKIAAQSLSTSYGKHLHQVMKDFQPDIVVFHYPNPFVAALLLRELKTTKAKLVVYWHLDIIRQKYLRILFAPQNRRLLECAAKVIATSPNYIEGSQWLQSVKEKCVVVPNCINVERMSVTDDIQKRAEEIRAKNSGKTICVAVGRHTEYKGFTYLIQASKLLDGRFVIYITGTGELTEKLHEEANDDKKVVFTGQIDDMELKALILASDIFCFPSITKNEAFGLALAEGMYCGKPAVTFTIPGSGVNYVSINGETGIEVENRNAKKYAEAMKKLADDAELREKYGDAGRKRVEENFLSTQFCENARRMFSRL